VITLPALANLVGVVTDDGLSPAPVVITTMWSKVSGPGTITFGTAQTLSTTAMFSLPGSYVLRLTASDNATAMGSDDVVVTVQPRNLPPVVNAGPDRTIAFPAPATLMGMVTDDHNPNPPDAVVVTWSKVSGPGTVVFTHSHTPSTTATFSAPGDYVLRLSANDSAATSSGDVTIRVRRNLPPVVDAGLTQTITLPATAALAGTVADDGFPVPPGTITATWSKVSGPGTVTFANPQAPATTATFSLPGAYVLRLAATDGALVGSDVTSVVVRPRNRPPNVNAGPDKVVTMPAAANLMGVVTDDGLSPASVLITSAWSQVSGPGNTLFSNAQAPATTATFSAPGRYVLRLTASDNAAASARDDMMVTVLPADTAPQVYAGPDQLIALPGKASLVGVVTDDGLPNPPGAVSVLWSQVSGPGTVAFTKLRTLSTAAMFSLPGTYVLRLTATDGQQTTSDDVSIRVAPPNSPPLVHAGSDQTITLLEQASLAGTVTDDGLPNPPGAVSVTWSKNRGPGIVTLANARARTTTATFSRDGTYILRFTATDGAATVSDDMMITVRPFNRPPGVNAGPDQTITLPATATLAGVVTDDGLPTPPGLVTSTWSKISGPGTVTFANPQATNTTATFATFGVYVLRLTATDGALTASNDLTIIVHPPAPINRAPLVDAGLDRTINFPTKAMLVGTVSDDGLPTPPGAVTTLWSKISGPGTVTFANAQAVSTMATFSTPGAYVLRLRASDSVLAASNDVTITVLPNAFPNVNAGVDQTITFPAQVSLTGTVTDDGLPNPPAAVSVLWSKNRGPGVVTFANPRVRATTATFTRAGTYILRLTATDGAATVFDDVTITVLPNQRPPVVNAGADQTITLPAAASLTGIVTDDHLPNPPDAVTVTWSKVNGPGSVVFSNNQALNTMATFSVAGTYVLRLTANDSALIGSDTVTITVRSPLPGLAPTLQQARLFATAAAPIPTLHLDTPTPGVRLAGSAVRVGATGQGLSAETAVHFQWRPQGHATFLSIAEETLVQEDPQGQQAADFFVPWNTVALVDGDYDLQALATLPSGETLASPLVRVTVSNRADAPPATLVEDPAQKHVHVQPQRAESVKTSAGIVVSFPLGALPDADDLRLTTHLTPPGQALPGRAVGSVVEIALASGQTTSDELFMLMLPYTDADHDGLVDHTDPPVPAATLTLWGFDPLTQTWAVVPDTQVYPEARVILGHTNRFTVFGVFYRPEP